MTDLWGDPDAEVDHPLIGRQVRVRLDAEHWIEGELLSLTAGGEVDIKAPDELGGRTHYAWPALEIVEMKESPGDE